MTLYLYKLEESVFISTINPLEEEPTRIIQFNSIEAAESIAAALQTSIRLVSSGAVDIIRVNIGQAS